MNHITLILQSVDICTVLASACDEPLPCRAEDLHSYHSTAQGELKTFRPARPTLAT